LKHFDALCKMIFSKLAGQKLLVSEPSPLQKKITRDQLAEPSVRASLHIRSTAFPLWTVPVPSFPMIIRWHTLMPYAVV